MEKQQFIDKLKDKKVSPQIIKAIADKVYNYINKNNLNFNSAITLISKIDGLDQSMLKAEFKIDSKGLVKTKNLPKLIETLFDLLNQGNIYYLEQVRINEIVKYMNTKLHPLVNDSYVDKKIFKRILHNIDSSKVTIKNYYELEQEWLTYFIVFNIVTDNENKSETFDLIFTKKIMFNEDFESSKWNFSFWTLNEFVNELKACIKWMKTN